MIVKFDTSKPFKLLNIEEEFHNAKCFICGKNSESRIFYDIGNDSNCVCCDCESLLEGMFKDYLIAESNFDKSQLVKKLDVFREKTFAQLERLSNCKGFSYYSQIEIVDYFDNTYSLEDIQQNNIADSLRYNYCYNQMIRQMQETYGETPFVVRFFYAPDFYDELGEYERESDTICGIAKIYNNGTTVIFGDKKIVLERSKYHSGDYNFSINECLE